MKYDLLNKKLVGMDGQPLTMAGQVEGLTAKKALQFALLTDTANNAASKLARYDLYIKLKDANEKTDFKIEEVATLKEAALTMSTIAAGQLVHTLEQKE
jgi:hypothetical protein